MWRVESELGWLGDVVGGPSGGVVLRERNGIACGDSLCDCGGGWENVQGVSVWERSRMKSSSVWEFWGGVCAVVVWS